jgi:hypothetical protein
MKTRFAIAIIGSSLVFALGAHGQSNNPVVVSPSAAPSPSVAPTVAPSTVVTPNQIVYAQRLPSVTELTDAAAAQGLTIDKIEQTSAQITVVYRYANGQINTVAYLLLPNAGVAANTVVTPSTPAPAVVYEAAPRVVYYDDFYGPGYYPYYWYPPVSFRVGLGFNYHYGYHGGFGGGSRGGFHGGYRGFHH